MSARKSRGAVLVAEVTPASLACDGGQYYDKSWRQAASLIVTPPIRWAAALQIFSFYNMTCVCREGEAEALAEGVSSGVLDIVSSHHAAYNSQQRALGKDSFVNIPKGVTGVEERMVSADLHQIFFMFCQIFFSVYEIIFPQVVLWQKCVRSGAMSRQRFVEATSAGAAKILNIYPQKGR